MKNQKWTPGRLEGDLRSGKGIVMKIIRPIILLSFLLALVVSWGCSNDGKVDDQLPKPSPPAAASSDWLEYGRSNKGDVYSYNKTSIKQRTADVLQVWEKKIISDKSREEDIEYYRSQRLSTKGYEKLSYKLILQEIDCKKKTYRILSIIEYDTDDHVLDSLSFDKPDWGSITPGSVIDALRGKVCKKQ